MTLTAVPGLRVGHATADGGETGCTVIVGPFRAAGHVTGLATGTRELDALDPGHLVPRVDALLLTGGSAFGLAAADGVMGWLEERGRGYETGAAKVPIVPAAVIYDLAPGRPRPGPTLGRAACEAAGDGPVPGGRVGAGAGATVGSVAGPERSMPGGIGSVSGASGGRKVGALVVVNAFGDVTDGTGTILAGARSDDGSFLDTARLLREEGLEGAFGAGRNTTLAVVATDAPLSRTGLARLARMAATALPRRISPVNTLFDGDVVFALTTAGDDEDPDAGRQTALGITAAALLEEAIEAAVTP